MLTLSARIYVRLTSTKVEVVDKWLNWSTWSTYCVRIFWYYPKKNSFRYLIENLFDVNYLIIFVTILPNLCYRIHRWTLTKFDQCPNSVKRIDILLDEDKTPHLLKRETTWNDLQRAKNDLKWPTTSKEWYF